MSDVADWKHGFLGRVRPSRRALLASPRLSTFLATDFAAPPPSIDYRGGITAWGMLGNNVAGNCVIAGVLHTIMARAAFVAGKAISFTDGQALGLYSRITGYDPATGANDNGTDMRTALEYWRTVGFLGNKIAGWCAVDPTNPVELRTALQIFGPLLAGVNLLKSAEDEFDQGLPWDRRFWTYSLGGPCIPFMGYGPNEEDAVTWGRDQVVENSYTTTECEELYAVVDSDWLKNGKSPTGLDLDGLLAASAKFAA